MPILHEFKAKVPDAALLEEKLQTLQPVFKGEDLQTDTYFDVPQGRLKLREGAVENALIHYHRPDVAAAKTSAVTLYKNPSPQLKAVLLAALPVKVIVQKKRRIYFIDNVKFHFDEVAVLGQFIEVEAIDEEGTVPPQTLEAQCKEYKEFFGIVEAQMVAESYSDMLLALPPQQ